MRAVRIEPQLPGLRPAPAPCPEPVANVEVAPAGRSPWRAILWATLGFVTGAVFWHVVGFWTFVSDVVLNRPLDAGGILRAEAPVVAVPTIYLVDPATCTALMLDRQTNQTVVRPCPQDGLALRLQPEGRRGDLSLAELSTIQAGYRPN